MNAPFHELIQSLTPRYGISEARSIARIVLEDAFQTRQYEQFLLPDAAAAAEFDRIKAALVAGQPVQYVLGMADFFGLKFKVSPATLIPRQETEELVDWAIWFVKKSLHPRAHILDIGLGSGCIGLTIKKKLPQISLTGIEKSAEALHIARENAQQLLGLSANDVQLLEGDMLTDSFSNIAPPDLVISNPPYIPRHEAAVMPEHVLAHEPDMALFVDDPDALLFYRVISKWAMERLNPGGGLFFECNEFNAHEVEAIVTDQGFEQVELRKDIAGANRMVFGVKKQN